MHNTQQDIATPLAYLPEVAGLVQAAERRGYDRGFIRGEAFGGKDRQQKTDRAMFIAGVVGMGAGSALTVAILLLNAMAVAS